MQFYMRIPNITLEVTGDKKVFGQNVCSLLTHLQVFPMNQKLPVRTRILCSFRIWAQKFLLSSLVKSNEIIFEKSKKLVWDKIFSTHFCISHNFHSKLEIRFFIYIPPCRAEANLQNALFEILLSFNKVC